MADSLFDARIRAQRFWFRDGLAEIMLGVCVLTQMGGNLIIHSHSEPGIFIYLLLLFAFAIYARRIMDAVRERITYRRSGYVHELGRERRIVVWMIVALLVGSAIVVAARYVGRAGGANPAGSPWFPALTGLGAGVVEVYWSMRYRLRRALVVGIFSMVLGVVLSIEYPPKLAFTIWCAGFGCASLCSGGIALLTYLRTTPPVANES